MNRGVATTDDKAASANNQVDAVTVFYQCTLANTTNSAAVNTNAKMNPPARLERANRNSRLRPQSNASNESHESNESNASVSSNESSSTTSTVDSFNRVPHTRTERYTSAGNQHHNPHYDTHRDGKGRPHHNDGRGNESSSIYTGSDGDINVGPERQPGIIPFEDRVDGEGEEGLNGQVMRTTSLKARRSSVKPAFNGQSRSERFSYGVFERGAVKAGGRNEHDGESEGRAGDRGRPGRQDKGGRPRTHSDGFRHGVDVGMGPLEPVPEVQAAPNVSFAVTDGLGMGAPVGGSINAAGGGGVGGAGSGGGGSGGGSRHDMQRHQFVLALFGLARRAQQRQWQGVWEAQRRFQDEDSCFDSSESETDTAPRRPKYRRRRRPGSGSDRSQDEVEDVSRGACCLNGHELKREASVDGFKCAGQRETESGGCKYFERSLDSRGKYQHVWQVTTHRCRQMSELHGAQHTPKIHTQNTHPN